MMTYVQIFDETRRDTRKTLRLAGEWIYSSGFASSTSIKAFAYPKIDNAELNFGTIARALTCAGVDMLNYVLNITNPSREGRCRVWLEMVWYGDPFWFDAVVFRANDDAPETAQQCEWSCRKMHEILLEGIYRGIMGHQLIDDKEGNKYHVLTWNI